MSFDIDSDSMSGVQILMQLGKYLVFNHDLHEIRICIVKMIV